MRHVLQISDCHLVVHGNELIGVDTQASLEAVLGQAMAEHQPDAIIASGDIAHDPCREVYSRFLATVRRFSAAPLLCVPGNHDVLGVMQAVDLPCEPVTVGKWALIGLDSHEDELPKAHITASDRAQVRQALSETTAEHCLITTHHPLAAVNSPWLDKDRIQNPEELIDWLAECSIDGDSAHAASRLRGVVFGHAHQPVQGNLSNVPFFGVPSTCFQFRPNSEAFAIDDAAPGYRWVMLHDDGGLTTAVHRVDSFSINVQLNT